MAVRLSEHVLGGEIFNTTYYSVHGWLELRGREQPLVLQLTGNCSPDLAGWHFRFEAQRTPGDAPPQDDFPELEQLATQQIGPTGTMTAARQDRGGALAAQPSPSIMPDANPVQSARSLHLEWFSQNGRMVIELANPVLEFVEYQSFLGGSPASGISDPDPGTPQVPAENPQCPAHSSGGDEEVESGDKVTFGDEGDEDGRDADPYQLFPPDLQLQLDLEASQTDWSLLDDEDKPQAMRELELMEDLIEHSEGVPLSSLFDGPIQLPLPDRLGDQEVESALKALLAQLALYGVALDVCKHFSPREAYRLLIEEICPEERAYPELRDTQWVQHHSTSDYCPQCQAELDREFNQRDSGDWPGENDPDDEIEF